MGQLFSVSFASTSVANASGDYDLFEFDAAADRPIEILSVELSVVSSADWTEEEQLNLSIVRGHTTSGNGTSATPRPLPFPNSNITAAFTAETIASTPASTGTGVVIWQGGWNIRAPGPIFPPAPQGFGYGTTDAGGLLVVRLNTAVADDVNLIGTALVYEY